MAVDLVQVDATVTDARGRHVPDLTAGDFEVLQDGRPQTISTFAYVRAGAAPGLRVGVPPSSASSRPISPDRVTRTIAIVVDDLGLSFESTFRVREVLRRFIERDVQAGDLVAILRTGAGMGALQQFTTDRRALHAAVEGVRWNFMARGSPFQAATEADQRIDGSRNELFTAGTLGAIRYVVRGVSELPGRKSVVVLSDGFRLTDADDRHGRIIDSLRSLVDAANRAGVVIYTIDARGLSVTSPTAADDSRLDSVELLEARREELRATQDGLGVLARETGGLFVHNSNDLAGSIRRVLDDQQGYYLLGYVPQSSTFSATKPRYHSLRVRMTRPGLQVRSRHGFLGRPEEPSANRTAESRMISAVTSPFAGGDIRLRLSSFFGQVEKVGPVVQSFVHVDARDLTFSEEPDGTRVAQVETLALTFGENGQVADEKSRRHTVTLSSERHAEALKTGFFYSSRVAVKRPGPYQLRIALRDLRSDRIGSASHFVDVPDVKKGRLTLSGLLIQRASRATMGGADTDDAVEDSEPTGTVALRAFRQGTEAYYGCYVYNARRGPSGQPQLESETRLYRNGVEVLRAEPRPVVLTPEMGGQVIAGGVLRFGPTMLPGSYLLEIAVTDRLAKKRARATQTIDFDVID
jgi:VWFA-related protein